MPAKKNTSTPELKTDDTEDVSAHSKSAVETGVASSEVDSLKSNESENRQLFFSTDGEDTPERKPLDDAKAEGVNEGKNSFPSMELDPNGAEKNQESPTKVDSTKERGSNSHPKSGQPGQSQGSKKMSWQDKKKLRKRQKFKKPQRLPYEETESKPLEIGQLIESDSLKTIEGISEILQPIIDTGKDHIDLDEFLVLSLLDLTERVRQIPLDSHCLLPQCVRN